MARPFRAALLTAALAVATAGCAAGAAAPSIVATTGVPAPASPPPEPTACPTFGVRLNLASDRLVDVTLASGPDADTATFRLGPPSPDGSAAGLEPEAILGAATPPFSYAQSGSVFDVSGSRFAEIRFIGMTVADPAGRATFEGVRDQETEFRALRQLTVYEEAAGVVAWVIGMSGGGCAALAPGPADTIVLSIEHR